MAGLEQLCDNSEVIPSDKVVYSQILAENERYSINICYEKLYYSINCDTES